MRPLLNFIIRLVLLSVLAGCSTAPTSTSSTPVVVIRVGPNPSTISTPKPLPTADPALIDISNRSPLDAPRQVNVPTQTNEVPMLTINGLPAVEVFINGSGPYRFVIDWGANIFAMSPVLAGELQLPSLGVDIMGNQNAHVALLKIDDTEFQDLTVVLDPFFSQSEEDGVLGRNVYESLLTTLDYPAQRVRWEKGQLPEPDGKGVLAYSPTEGGAPMIEIALGAQNYWAVLDTGASRWIIWPASQIDQLAFKFGPVKGNLATGPQLGVADTKMGRLSDDITFGSYTISQPIVDIIDRPEILIGSRLLKNFTVTLDQQNQRVSLTRTTTDPIIIPTATWETLP